MQSPSNLESLGALSPDESVNFAGLPSTDGDSVIPLLISISDPGILSKMRLIVETKGWINFGKARVGQSQGNTVFDLEVWECDGSRYQNVQNLCFILYIDNLATEIMSMTG